ncbi:uncharacterized protein V1518DRAFT_171395 [Limtongia smithiae]|uniref:uncharacterized protein n=1 Tax=Limtongia smithiae TaxID=1125753 RepID=UPI0034CE379C
MPLGRYGRVVDVLCLLFERALTLTAAVSVIFLGLYFVGHASDPDIAAITAVAAAQETGRPSPTRDAGFYYDYNYFRLRPRYAFTVPVPLFEDTTLVGTSEEVEHRKRQAWIESDYISMASINFPKNSDDHLYLRTVDYNDTGEVADAPTEELALGSGEQSREFGRSHRNLARRRMPDMTCKSTVYALAYMSESAYSPDGLMGNSLFKRRWRKVPQLSACCKFCDANALGCTVRMGLGRLTGIHLC